MSAPPMTSQDATSSWFHTRHQASGVSVEATENGPKVPWHCTAREFGFSDGDALGEFCSSSAVLLSANQLRFERRLRCTSARAWQLISDPSALSEWHAPTRIELRLGGRFEFVDAWGGHIGALLPGRLIRLDADAGGVSEFKLEPEGDGVRFTLEDAMGTDLVIPDALIGAGQTVQSEQPGGPGTHWAGVIAGWHSGVDKVQRLSGMKPPMHGYGVLVNVYRKLIAEYHTACIGVS